MKLSKHTISVLRNFTSIENSIVFNETSFIKIINRAGTTIGIAKIDEELPDFGVYNFGGLVQAISMFEEPELEFKDNSVYIKQGKRKVKYTLSPVELIENQCKPTEDYKKSLKSPDCEFEISEETLNALIKMGRLITNEPDKTYLQLKIEDGMCQMTISDSSVTNSNEYTEELECDGMADVKILVKNLQCLPGKYKIQVFDKRCIKLINTEKDLYYIIALYLG